MFKKAYRLVKSAIERIFEDEIFVYSAQGSFYIIIASIPFLMVFMEILKFFIPITRHEAVGLIGRFVPSGLKTFVELIIEELFSKSATVLSITGITAVWSASRGMAAVERGVQKVYKTKKDRNLFAGVAISVLYTLLFVGALIATLLLMVFGGTIFGFLKVHIPWLAAVGKIKNMMYFFLMFAFFTAMYKVFAGRATKLGDHVAGALFATMGWLLFSSVFSIYVENFANYSYIYGSLAMIVIMMIWLYSCMVILLLGAEINVWIKNKGLKGTER